MWYVEERDNGKWNRLSTHRSKRAALTALSNLPSDVRLRSRIGYDTGEDRTVSDLESAVAALRAQLAEYVSPFTLRQKIKEAVEQAYAAGLADGWRQGVFDLHCTVSPRHSEAVAITEGFDKL